MFSVRSRQVSKWRKSTLRFPSIEPNFPDALVIFVFWSTLDRVDTKRQPTRFLWHKSESRKEKYFLFAEKFGVDTEPSDKKREERSGSRFSRAFLFCRYSLWLFLVFPLLRYRFPPTSIFFFFFFFFELNYLPFSLFQLFFLLFFCSSSSSSFFFFVSFFFRFFVFSLLVWVLSFFRDPSTKKKEKKINIIEQKKTTEKRGEEAREREGSNRGKEFRGKRILSSCDRYNFFFFLLTVHPQLFFSQFSLHKHISSFLDFDLSVRSNFFINRIRTHRLRSTLFF